MTNAERALFLCNQASKRVSGAAHAIAAERVLAADQKADTRPATHLISGCFWPEAIAEINEAINELSQARTALAPLAEDRPRD